jgi:hypothetical protein
VERKGGNGLKEMGSDDVMISNDIDHREEM